MSSPFDERCLPVRGRRGAFPSPRESVSTRTEFATLDAICARLIPSDENGPGAKEAGRRIHRSRAGRAPGGISRRLLRGAGGHECVCAHEAAADHHVCGAGCGPAGRNPARDGAGCPTRIHRQLRGVFNLVRGHTLQGTFCDPIYGGNANMVGWDLIGYPGVRLTVAPREQNMSTPAARNHKSARLPHVFESGDRVEEQNVPTLKKTDSSSSGWAHWRCGSAAACAGGAGRHRPRGWHVAPRRGFCA